MDMLIGPLLVRNGTYSYETFTTEGGLRNSFRYLRVDAARYDQRALIAEARSDSGYRIRICDTQIEFERLIAAARAGGATNAETDRKS